MGKTITLLTVILVSLIFIKVRDLRFWETFYEIEGSKSNEASHRYTYLKSRGIRCRLQHVNSKIGAFVHSGNEFDTTVRLLVHKEDYNQAEHVMENFGQF
ncbi:hypothetical protein [Alkalibacillus aidingensis]|uniref:hypothetical protein n=1 Tax=Alkalibacillus aidingensis TaxID=2747607 RepID=UPI001660673F|nr:hypothetical protein [Alkalibacillus aidingensis]